MRRGRWLWVVAFAVIAAGSTYWVSRHQAPTAGDALTGPQAPYTGQHIPGTMTSSGAVILPRATLGSYGSLEEQGHPGWDLSRDPALVEKHAKGRDVALVLRCNCGKVIRLLDHRIAADGTLSPSIWHDIPGCGWHVFGKLQGWDGVEWDVGK